jgi:hypothetical protein
LKPEDLGQLFKTFRHSAFRLETLPAYAIEEEAESLRAWRAGEPRPAWYEDREWCRLVAEATAAGKRMQRVRTVRRPLSEYIRLELDWGYPQNVEAGEDIRILELGPDHGTALHDFWLFDDLIVVRLEYDDGGRFIQPVAASEDAPNYCRVRELVLAPAVPFASYRAQAV